MNAILNELDHVAIRRLLDRLDPPADADCCVAGCIHIHPVVDHSGCLLSAVA